MKTLLRTHRFFRLMLVVLLAGLLVVFGERLDKAHAASMVTVTSCPTETTLLADMGTAGSGGTVRFSISSPCTISIHPTLVISQDLTLDNNGQQVTLDGGGLAQVLLVNPHVLFTLTALTIGNGQAGDGGGLLANANSTVRISNSTFANNSAQFGGGLFADSGSTVRISNSTFTKDSAQFGGGLFANSGSTVRISNSTFANNSATSEAFKGRFFAWMRLPIRWKSVVEGITSSGFPGGFLGSRSQKLTPESTSEGGGFFNSAGRLRIGQSIVANNTSGGNCSPSGSITDTGYNLSNDTSCGFTAANHSVPNTNPQLDPAGLKNNGGPTQTIALLSGSPAIDQIPSAVCLVATDQRGFPRPDDNESVCDIGAYEIG